MKPVALPVVVLLVSFAASCALTSRSEPLLVRYFSAEPAAHARAPNPTAQTSKLNLRLEAVRSSAHLGEEIAYRTGVHELGYYAEERWAEKPEAFLERALARAFFHERGVTRVLGGASEALSVELVAFEEVRGPQPSALVEIAFTLHDERAGHLERTIRVERPLANTDKDRASAAVAALSEALDAAVEQLAQIVTERLTALAAAESPASSSAEAAAR